MITHTHTHTHTCMHSSPWLSAILPSSLTAFFAALMWCYRWGPLLRDQSKVFDSLLGMLVHTHGVQQRAKHEKCASTKRATCTTRSQLVPRRSPEVHLRLTFINCPSALPFAAFASMHQINTFAWASVPPLVYGNHYALS